MMMNPNNMDAVNNNLTELESFNTSSVHDFLLSLSANEGYCFDHHHHQRPDQIPFSFSHDSTTSPSSNNIPNYSSSLLVQAPVLNFDSVLANCFPQGGGPTSYGYCNNNIILSSEISDGLPNSSSGFLVTDDANGSFNHGGKKRKRSRTDREAQKPKDVVHVRAKRGQATDSHSLAERLRREKINEKLRCLQDLVPGCYKTMGMAVMLDVIINYVRSLQNQIDFLSMKLSTASLYYDFNSSDVDAMGTMQGMHGFEAQGMEKWMGEGYGVLPQSHTSLPL